MMVGDTHTERDEDLSLETLAADLAALLQTLFGSAQPDLFLVGHRCAHTSTPPTYPQHTHTYTYTCTHT
jgi:hypothetical protein